MLFEQFEVKGLSHYAYAVGCQAARRMVIVDPERNVDGYLAFAAQQGMEISHVLETHIHADFASGARALAERTGAEVMVSGYDEGETFAVAFPHRDLFDGDVLELGKVRIVARHTPGHTPEHLSFLVYDGARSTSAPMLMLTGDFLFVGSLGRPDLLGEEAKRALAGRLYESVQRLADLPDGLELHPAHGAGSMCGSGMSGRPTSTLGFERIANPYLDPSLTRDAFVERILGTVPPFPPYYRRMKAVNSAGPAGVPGTPAGRAIPAAEFRRLVDDGHVVIDLRGQAAFDGAHVPGSFGIGAGPNLATWAAWVVPYDTPLLLIGEHAASLEEAGRTLVRVGLDHIVGHLDGGIEAWRAAGAPLRQTTLLVPRAVHDRMASSERLRLVDVRSDSEWEAGRAPGALHIMGGELADRLDEIPDRAAPIAVICGGGYRSVVAASVLERAGYEDVIDVTGGMAAWRRDELPVEKDAAEPATAG